MQEKQIVSVSILALEVRNKKSPRGTCTFWLVLRRLRTSALNAQICITYVVLKKL